MPGFAKGSKAILRLPLPLGYIHRQHDTQLAGALTIDVLAETLMGKHKSLQEPIIPVRSLKSRDLLGWSCWNILHRHLGVGACRGPQEY